MRLPLGIITLMLVSGCGREPDTSQSEASQPVTSSTAKPSLRAELAAAETKRFLPDGPTEAEFPHLHNLLQVTDRIYTGGEPQDDQAFAELAKLGVRTVVSVDGALPQTDLAEKHGLRYVHIPIGYDGIPKTAGDQFAALVQQVDGPFYVHCHHGKHRGPAGAAIACIADGAADNEAALSVLQEAGTSPDYAGLWRDVRAYVPPTEGEDLPELVSQAEVGSVAAAMAQIDRASDNLKLCQAAKWQTPTDHPDITAAQEALLLVEGFRETNRQLEATNEYDDRFATWMREAERTAEELESATRSGRGDLNTLLANVQSQCKQCHKAYRN